MNIVIIQIQSVINHYINIEMFTKHSVPVLTIVLYRYLIIYTIMHTRKEYFRRNLGC